MIKKSPIYILTLVFSLLIAACSSEDNDEYQKSGKAIAFNSNAGESTRATENAEVALNKKIVVYGNKDNEVIFNGTEVKYANGSWTYSDLKYWDYTATKYTFTAYSLGKGDGTASPTYAGVSNANIDGFTLTGTKDQLTNCYFTDRQIVNKDNFNQTVNLKFNQLAAKVRLGFWEGIDGYSVNDVKFYSSADLTTTPTTTAVIYSNSSVFPNGGSYTISYDSSNKAQFTYTGSDDQKTNSINFGNITQGAIGTTLESCTKTDYTDVLPTTFTESIYINIRYTLVNGSNRETKTKIVEIKTKNNPRWDYQKQYTLAFEITKDGIKDLLITEEWDNDYRH